MSQIPKTSRLKGWLRQAGAYYSAPGQQEFNAPSNWTQSYYILNNAPSRTKNHIEPQGILRLSRKNRPDGKDFELGVEVLTVKQYFGSFRLRAARLVCQ